MNTEVAPRTAVGTTQKGELLLLELDGCEPSKGCKFNLGATESAMADLLLAHGAYLLRHGATTWLTTEVALPLWLMESW